MGEKTTRYQSRGVNIAGDQLPAIIEAATTDWKRLTDEQRQTIARLEGNLGVSAGALKAVFRTLGEAEVPAERQETKLVEIAERYKQLVAQVAAAPGDDPEVAKLKGEAKAALEAGQLERADDLLRVQAAQDAALERRQLEAAATAAQRGEIALTRLRYRDAAEHFAAAARRVPPGHEEQFLTYLDQEAAALYQQGDELGDTPALTNAIDHYRALLERRPRERVPRAWAMTQYKLGIALRSLGGRDLEKSGTARLEEAVDAFRRALEELTHPSDVATTQYNLGTVLSSLGERDYGSGTARLKEAVADLRRALEERPRKLVPRDWAITQNNLGRALWLLGQRENGTARLEEAVDAFREALKELTRPSDVATTQHNLGRALLSLGERAHDRVKLLEEARNALNFASEVFREQAGQGYDQDDDYFERYLSKIDDQLARCTEGGPGQR